MSRERDGAYDMVDKFLRNSLDDADYAEYLEALELLYTPEPEQDEPVDISDKFEPTIKAILPNGVRVTNVYEAYEAGLKEGTKQNKEPVAWVIPGGVTKSKDLAEANGNNAKPLYLHPAPRPEFVRLSEEEIMAIVRADAEFVRLTHDEVNSLMNRSLPSYELICAVENRLEEKNKRKEIDTPEQKFDPEPVKEVLHTLLGTER